MSQGWTRWADVMPAGAVGPWSPPTGWAQPQRVAQADYWAVEDTQTADQAAHRDRPTTAVFPFVSDLLLIQLSPASHNVTLSPGSLWHVLLAVGCRKLINCCPGLVLRPYQSLHISLAVALCWPKHWSAPSLPASEKSLHAEPLVAQKHGFSMCTNIAKCYLQKIRYIYA